MTFSEFLNITFVENEGITEEGQWLPKHIAALQAGLRELLTLSGHTDVDVAAGGSAAYDYVLFKATNSNKWTVKKASEIKPSVDSQPTQNSQNPVSSNGVYVALQDVINAINDIEQQLEDGVGARTLGELENVNSNVDESSLGDMVMMMEAGTTEWKKKLVSSLFDLSGKFGDVRFEDGSLKFYADENAQTPIKILQLSGTVYNVIASLENGTESIFSVLTGDEHTYISFSAETTAGGLGEIPSEFVENYTYVIAVDSGTGFVDKKSGRFNYGETATEDIRSYLVAGQNRVRITITGDTSTQFKSLMLSGTVTNLVLTMAHAWQTPWYENADYNLTNIRLSGNLQKTLHVKIGETELTQVFRPNDNYTTNALTYTIGAEYFPADESGVYEIEVWLTGGGVSTQHYKYNIMCLMDGDTTPLVCVNNIADAAVNYAGDRLFSYAVVNADSILLQPSVLFDGDTYALTALAVGVLEGQQYDYAPALELDIVNDEVLTGTMTTVVTPYENGTAGVVESIVQTFDNSHAFNATPGAVFYMNAAQRSNNEVDRDEIKNSATNASVLSYQATWNRFGWSTDGWAQDEYGHQALVVPARSSVAVAGLTPFAVIGNDGMTLEVMVRSANIADEDTPILTFVSGTGNNREGFILYPTKVLVLSTSSRSETLQSFGLCENVITHLAVTIQKGYNGTAGKNLCSIYVNGIPNVTFDFTGTDTFGNGGLLLGQANTDFYLYMMRIYNRALEGQDVFYNFLNAVFTGTHINRGEYDREQVRDNNDILDGTGIDYHYAVRKGFNCMVVEPDDPDAPLPDFYHKYDDSSMPCTMYFEYWGTHPEWNVKITNVPLDGQGTTSKKYMRWNLRGKLKSCDWFYADSRGNYDEEPTFTATGKGYMDGGAEGLAGHLKIERFTAKKNIASSQQGHKMGATALYDELFTQLGLKSELPNNSYRVAVWQYPFLGFVKRGDSYEYIGLYTCGPDKGCKVTFGYDKTAYPKAMCIEGPNHNPRATRFLHPWVDVAYSSAHETLEFGGQEGWDDDFSSVGSSDKASDEAAILACYKEEWKPAYDLVFHCSPYIASIAEMLASNTGYSSMADVNNDFSNFLKGTTTYTDENGVSRTRSNDLMSFYDTNYDIWFQRVENGQPARFEKLLRQDGDNADNLWRITTYLSSYLNGVSSPTTAQILAARKLKFRTEMATYFSLDQTLYHKCFCLLIGAKDNDAKNSYPFKHLALAADGKWGWKQDDLDSIFDTDNNGQATVKYSAEYGDQNDGVEIFQGSDSAFWTIIWEWYQTEISSMMARMMEEISLMAGHMGFPSGDPLHQKVYNVLAHYFFDQSALYFPAIAYQHDRSFGYIEPWFLAGQTIDGQTYDSVYNGVRPLTQAQGDRYQDERLWIERRIAYLFSKFSLGGFSENADGYGTASFTLAEGFSFLLTPAIDLYPTANTGGSGLVKAGRTMALQVATVALPTGGSTTNYINGLDWLYSLGDLSGMRLTGRGGSSDITFSVTSQRLHDLKVGDAVASNVVFNATELSVTGASLVEIDARNTTTLNKGVDLSQCPRLQTALFEGSMALGIMLAEGARVEEVSFPERMPTLFLHSLNFLQAEDMTLSAAACSTVASYYFNCCAHLNPIDILASILAGSNVLHYVTMIWEDVLELTENSWMALVMLATGTNTTTPASGSYGRVTYQDGEVGNAGTMIPLVQGTISVGTISKDDYDVVHDTFPNLTIQAERIVDYLTFEDQRVWEICCYNWGDTQLVSPGSAFASGEIEADGSALVVSDHVFASCLVHPKRTKSDGTSPAQVAAAARTFEIELQFDTATPFSSIAAGSTVIEIRQYAGNTSTQVVVGTLAKEDVVLDGNNKLTITTSGTTNACQYLTVAVLANNGVTAQFIIKVAASSASGIYQPVGISQTQCAAVSSLGTVFRDNKIIKSVVELRYFVGQSVGWSNTFINCSSIQKIVIPGFTSSSISVNYNAIRSCPQLRYIYISTSNYVIMNGSNGLYGTNDCPVYVPDNLVDTYKSGSGWSQYASRIKPWSEFQG